MDIYPIYYGRHYWNGHIRIRNWQPLSGRYRQALTVWLLIFGVVILWSKGPSPCDPKHWPSMTPSELRQHTRNAGSKFPHWIVCRVFGHQPIDFLLGSGISEAGSFKVWQTVCDRCGEQLMS